MHMDFVSRHLDNKNSYARTVFIDFSSAFNTIVSHILVKNATSRNICNLYKCILVLERRQKGIFVRK